uniref:DNA/RNA non-specific endonuclease domain-containing protein n=1 Tax=Strigamia maritima TaxID=126957 RepID=T1IJZ9_STRMM
MATIRAFYLLAAAGVGYACGLSIDEKRRNSFKVKAQMLRVPKFQYPERVRRLRKYGSPKRDTILQYDDFQVSFDRRNRTPNYVVERLQYGKLKTQPSSGNFKFHADDGDEIAGMFQPKAYDYVKSGYWKGRLVAGKNHNHTPNSHKDTYKLTTVVPQVPGFAISAWADLECYLRYLTHSYKSVYVFTGSLYLPKDEYQFKSEVIGDNHVAVPTHFYKLVICDKHEGGVDMGCYLMENDSCMAEICEPLSTFRITLEQLESIGRFKLFKDPKAHTYFGELPDIPDFRVNVQEYMEKVGLGHVV